MPANHSSGRVRCVSADLGVPDFCRVKMSPPFPLPAFVCHMRVWCMGYGMVYVHVSNARVFELCCESMCKHFVYKSMATTLRTLAAYTAFWQVVVHLHTVRRESYMEISQLIPPPLLLLLLSITPNMHFPRISFHNNKVPFCLQISSSSHRINWRVDGTLSFPCSFCVESVFASQPCAAAVVSVYRAACWPTTQQQTRNMYLFGLAWLAEWIGGWLFGFPHPSARIRTYNNTVLFQL